MIEVLGRFRHLSNFGARRGGHDCGCDSGQRLPDQDFPAHDGEGSGALMSVIRNPTKVFNYTQIVKTSARDHPYGRQDPCAYRLGV